MKIGIFLAILLVGFFVYLFFQEQKRETNWSNLCRENGGTVQLVNSYRLDCFKDGKIILKID